MIKRFFSQFIKQSKPGVTLMEVLVSVTIFIVLMLSVMEIFQMALASQRQVLASQNLQENIKYFFEVISKEIRMAQKNEGGLCMTHEAIFDTGSNAYGDVLYFINYHGECVIYYLDSVNDNLRFVVNRNGNWAYLTPEKINILDLNFVVMEEPNLQPYVTISILAETTLRGEEITKLQLQTTISSRYYK